MKLFMLAVYDAALGAFMPPFCVPAVNVGVRGFSDALKDSSTELSKHPGDYVLMQVGEFDQSSGRVAGMPDGMPVQVVRGDSIKEVG